MKKVTTVLLAIALSIPVLAFAQNTNQENKRLQQEEDNQAADVNMMGRGMRTPHQMTGVVSNDGKNLTVGNTTYVVDNPTKLKSYDGRTVSVRFDFHTSDNTLHILSVSSGQAG
ncbi:MAG TPA: hypothetical protein VKV05_13800 [Terriglobales bacterium]|nr:hypothetical protein [Terriglobales bacterium]